MKRMILGTAVGATSLLAGIVVGAFAQTPPPPLPPLPPHVAMFHRPPALPICTDGAAWLAGWAAFAQVKLRVTPDQSTAWQGFVDDVSSSVKPLQALCPPPPQAGAPPAPPGAASVLEVQQKMLAARFDSVGLMRAAVERLSSSLTTEQRGTLIQVLPPLMGPPPMAMAGDHPPPRP